MTEETTSAPASSPAADPLSDILRSSAEREDITPAHEETPDYDEQFAEEPDNGEQPDKPKKLSGAQRAKRREEYLLNEHRAREESLLNENREMQLRLEELQAQRDGRSDEDRRKRNNDAHLERLKDARGAIADFDATMSRMAGVAIHDDLIEEIVSSDKSPLLAYHLAQNPDKLRELNHMSAREMAREIGRLETSLKMPEGRKQTKAPPPLTSLKGGAAPHTALEQVSDMNEFASRLMKDLAKRSKR